MIESPISKKRKRVFLAFIWGVTLSLGLLLAEILIRTLRPELSYRELCLRFVRERDSNPTGPHRLFHHAGENQYAIEFPQQRDSQGNILLVGDSFTWGSAASPGNRFADRLQRAVETKRKIDVVAMPSTSPLVYRNFVGQAISRVRFEAVAVFIDQTDPADDFAYERDLKNTPGVHEFDVERLEQRAREVHQAYEDGLNYLHSVQGFTHRFSTWNLFRRVGVETFFPRSSAHFLDVQLAMSRRPTILKFNEKPDDLHTVGMEHLLYRNIDEIVRMTKEKNIPLFLAANPWEFQVSNRPGGMERISLPLPRANRLEALLSARYGKVAKIVPLTASFRAHPSPSDLFEHTPPGEIHWGDAGHAVVAQILQKSLEDAGVVPLR